MKIFIWALIILSALSCCVWSYSRIAASISFTYDCMEYLKLAADASVPSLAKENLDKAIDYLERKNLTSGTVSIFWHKPSNSVSFFYRNLKSAQSQLQNILEAESTNIDSIAQTNLLMKLRDTLVDSGDSVTVTCPEGMDIYPCNLSYFWWVVISLIVLIICIIIWFNCSYYR